jgi:hypothetical protein
MASALMTVERALWMESRFSRGLSGMGLLAGASGGRWRGGRRCVAAVMALVEETEVLAFEGGRLALRAVGLDVAAETTLHGRSFLHGLRGSLFHVHPRFLLLAYSHASQPDQSL